LVLDPSSVVSTVARWPGFWTSQSLAVEANPGALAPPAFVAAENVEAKPTRWTEMRHRQAEARISR